MPSLGKLLLHVLQWRLNSAASRSFHVSTHPTHMLKYAVVHNWSEETINTIAKETIDVRAPRAWEVLGPEIYVRWVCSIPFLRVAEMQC